MNRNKKPCMLMILDGWGISPEHEGNAVYLAKTPALNELKKKYPNAQLTCSGEAVGLPKGIMGNSEVGHLNIGAGRIVYQYLLRIDMAIHDGEFIKNKEFCLLMSKVNKNSSVLHLIGLVSDGGVHSQLTHLFALLDMAQKKGVAKVYIHAILDGRDTPPESGANYIKQLQEHINTIHLGEIVTVCGRYYAMDRDNRWDRIEKAFNLYTKGEGRIENDPVEAVKKAYMQGETDEFIKPVIIATGKNKSINIIRDGDGIIFFNFRSDRAREITRAFTDPDFEPFKRDLFPKLCGFVCMTLYDEKFSLPLAFPPVYMKKILGEVVSKKGLKQLRIAETEKYAHVTYFFNGGKEKAFPLEDRCLVHSPRDVATYDLKPEMSADKVTDEVISRIESNDYDLIVLNFANMDMVGHTGKIDAAIKACETVDGCVKKIIDKVKAKGGVVLVTADHGNAEKMLGKNGHPHTAHTLNPVPFIYVDDSFKDAAIKNGSLQDIAPTILNIMGIDKPKEMTGKTLIESAKNKK